MKNHNNAADAGDLPPTKIEEFAEANPILLEAVRAYPVAMASTNRGGRNAKENPAKHPAKLKPAYVAKLQRRGRERWLIYRLAVLTGLRRGEPPVEPADESPTEGFNHGADADIDRQRQQECHQRQR